MIGQDMIGKYVVIRTCSAGVHTGILTEREGAEVVLRDSRRIWFWSGAATLSQLATDGVTQPDECKFSVSVSSILLTQAIEIIPATGKAESIIRAVKDWAE